MDDTRVTPEEIEAALAEKLASALNGAGAGRIIAESEMPVRDAHLEFRQTTYTKVLGLLQAKREAFSPSAHRQAESRQTRGDAPDGERSG